MFIDFEGIDGSGKTTISNQVAKALRALGHPVCHAREGGELQTAVARRVRDLTRDSTLLEMGSRAELFLNLARDAQQVEEVIRPALLRNEICISDRYLFSQLALSGGARGLPAQAVRHCLDLASQEIWPDLVILVDVDPELARLRKRVSKLQDEARAGSEGSRKGLYGAGLNVHVRDAFLRMARADPERWVVIENNDVPLKQICDRVIEIVRSRIEGRMTETRPINPPRRPLSTEGSLEDRFFRALDELETREPQLAVFMLSGIPGLAAHQRRLSYAERFPQLTAASLNGLYDAESYALREILKTVAPRQVIESLGDESSPRAMALRQELYEKAPAAVLASLRGNDSTEAWRLRERALWEERLGQVLAGLGDVDTRLARELRESGLRAKQEDAVLRSLSGLSGEGAEATRRELFAKNRLGVLRSVAGLDTPFARHVRASLFERAMKPVLRSLTGIASDEAFELRRRGAPLTKEALDSCDGLDADAAWEFRRAFAGKWPATVISSLRGLATTPRGEALILDVLERCPNRMPVLRNAYAVTARASAAEQQARNRLAAEPTASTSSLEAVALAAAGA